MTNLEKELIKKVSELEDEVERLTERNESLAECLSEVFDNLVIMLKLELERAKIIENQND